MAVTLLGNSIFNNCRTEKSKNQYRFCALACREINVILNGNMLLITGFAPKQQASTQRMIGSMELIAFPIAFNSILAKPNLY